MRDCVFCKIAAGELPATIIQRTAELVAFRDIHPQAPTHILVIPTRHILSVAEMLDADVDLVGRMIALARDVARHEQLDNGFRLVINSGPQAGQTVDHLHVHILGGRAMHWPPG